jgi:hypothetical protein
MTEIALDCGYPASSLKERVYALSSARTAGLLERCGLLIYTATPGAQGTLGGLGRLRAPVRHDLARRPGSHRDMLQ